MLSIKQLYDRYPDADLLPIDVDETTTLNDIEQYENSGGIGDTLFLFLCRELCDQDIPYKDSVLRGIAAVTQIMTVVHAVQLMAAED